MPTFGQLEKEQKKRLGAITRRTGEQANDQRALRHVSGGAGQSDLNKAGVIRNRAVQGAQDVADDRLHDRAITSGRSSGRTQRGVQRRRDSNKHQEHLGRSRQVARKLVQGRKHPAVKRAIQKIDPSGLMRDSMNAINNSGEPIQIRGSLYNDPKYAAMADQYGDEYAMKVRNLDSQINAARQADQVMADHAKSQADTAGSDAQYKINQNAGTLSDINTQAQVAQHGTPDQVQQQFGGSAVRDPNGNIVTPPVTQPGQAVPSPVAPPVAAVQPQPIPPQAAATPPNMQFPLVNTQAPPQPVQPVPQIVQAPAPSPQDPRVTTPPVQGPAGAASMSIPVKKESGNERARKTQQVDKTGAFTGRELNPDRKTNLTDSQSKGAIAANSKGKTGTAKTQNYDYIAEHAFGGDKGKAIKFANKAKGKSPNEVEAMAVQNFLKDDLTDLSKALEKAKTVRDVFEGKTSSTKKSPPKAHPDAKQAKDGKWYIQQNGKYHQVTE